MSALQEMLERMKAGEVSGDSEFEVRDENLRTKIRTKQLNRVELKKGLRMKVMIHTEVAVPLDPETGLPSEKYNEDHLYRPLVASSTMMKIWKTIANEKPETKAFLLKGSGVTDWDTSYEMTEPEEGEEAVPVVRLNPTDLKVFDRFRGPRYFTLNVVNVKDPRITGKEDSSRQYRLDVKRDALGKIEGVPPKLLQIAWVYQQLAFAESNEVRAYRAALLKKEEFTSFKCKRSFVLKEDLAALTSDDFDEKIIRPILQDVPVTGDNPSNYVVGNAFLTDRKQYIPEGDVREMGDQEFNDTLSLFRCNQKMQDGLAMYKPTGTLKVMDVYPDVLELVLEAPETIEKPTGNDKMDLGRYTNYTKPTVYLAQQDPEFKDFLLEKIAAGVDADPHFERRFMVSTYVRNVDDALIRQLLDLMVLDNILKHPYMTVQILTNNIDIIREAYGPEYDSEIDAMLVKAKLGISVELGTQEIDLLEAEKQSKKVSLMEIATSEEEIIEESSVVEEEEQKESHHGEGTDTAEKSQAKESLRVKELDID